MERMIVWRRASGIGPFHPGLVVLLLIAVLAARSGPARAATELRIASYNIKRLDAGTIVAAGDRLEKLRAVLDALEADVIALQEIRDRAALEAVFDPDAWWLVIDDDSGEYLDLAFAVRRPLVVAGIDDLDQDAGPEDFLCETEPDRLFPGARDVLAVAVTVPAEDGEVWILNVHAKARAGGRHATDARREDASRVLVDLLEREFDERLYVLLGDFNDTPDDRSLNILETGDPMALAGPEQIEGPFLVNLMEPLWVLDQCSYGRKSQDAIDEVTVDLVDAGARARNNERRGTDRNTGDALFDQILVPPSMHDRLVPDSAAIFAIPQAVVGNDTTRASDHLPVVASFLIERPLDDGDHDEDQGAGRLRITGLLPNPDGDDHGNEQVVLTNGTDAPIDLDGWTLRDRADNRYAFDPVTIAAGATVVFTMLEFSMPLNNTGDEIELRGPDGETVDRVEYPRSRVEPGVTIRFDDA